MTTAAKEVTADQLLEMGDIGRCELIYGELVMMSPAGAEHGEVAARFSIYVGSFVLEQKLGTTFAAETGFKLASDPDLVRAPDVSFVRAERLASRRPKGFFPGAPDLAIEVASPDDTRRAVAEKVSAWLAHGTTSVWVADPKLMTTAVHHTGRQPMIFGIGQTLTDDLTLPDFTLEMAKIFAAAP
jgi:Uma2 family endonuclease